jgi:hypothetical protein
MPILTYGADTWTWTRADIGRQIAVEIRFKEVQRENQKKKDKKKK